MNENFIDTLNDFGKNRKPAFFAINFDKTDALVCKLSEAADRGVLYDIDGARNFTPPSLPPLEVRFAKSPVSFDLYRRSFDLVREHLRQGNSYLCNLTFPTPIETNLTLEDFFFRSTAKFRLLVRDRFAVFSPERFVTIKDNAIATFPMKGTIDANQSGAKEKLLADEKELAEHVTVVDLLRNDLSKVSKGVAVESFRDVVTVDTVKGGILQTVSKITGRLPADWRDRIGSILDDLLPAGSVTGAPKRKTLEIIREAETDDRGYYTGVFGVFDGETLDSAVAIRFVEQTPGGLLYRSGGGITIDSDARSEYNEMAGKVYVPFR